MQEYLRNRGETVRTGGNRRGNRKFTVGETKNSKIADKVDNFFRKKTLGKIFR